MKKSTVELLIKTSEEIGMEDIEARFNYSGRGMFGKTTCGVVLPKINNFICLVASTVQLNLEEEKEFDIDSFIDDVSSIKQDNMGHDIIVY